MIVSITTPTMMMMEVPPKDTFALKIPLKKIGSTATTVNPAAPIKMM